MSPHNSQLVACGGEVVVAVARNAVAIGDVVAATSIATASDVVVVVGVVAMVG